MKRMINRIFAISLVWFIGFGLLSCSKSESPYYDYENTVQSYDGDALQYLKAQPAGSFDSLLLVLNHFPNLQDSLTNNQLTLFAPVNKNFEYALKYLNLKRVQQGKSTLHLSTVDQVELYEMICKYIVRGNRSTVDYVNDADGLPLESIEFGYPMHVKYLKLSSSGFVGGGASTLNFSDTFGSTFNKDWVTTKATTVNVKTKNATINILEPIHNFGFDEFTLRLNN